MVSKTKLMKQTIFSDSTHSKTDVLELGLFRKNCSQSLSLQTLLIMTALS